MRGRSCARWSAKGGGSMPADPVVAGYLAAVADDLDAARRLAAPPANRLAVYHLQQAAEKLIKAVLVHRRIHPGLEHRIDVLARVCSTPPIHGSRSSTPWIASPRMPRPTGIQAQRVA